MEHKTAQRIQIARIIVQAAFLIAVILGLSTRELSTWMLPIALLFGVFFCGWVCPLGTAQDWMWKLGRLLRLPQFKVSQNVQRYLQLSRYIFYYNAYRYFAYTYLVNMYLQSCSSFSNFRNILSVRN